MISTANQRLITGPFQTLTSWFQWLRKLVRDFSTAPTTTTVSISPIFSLRGDIFLRFEQVDKGKAVAFIEAAQNMRDEEFIIAAGKFLNGGDFLDRAIRHDFERRDREEWDGLFRGLAWTLAAATACLIAMGLPLSWQLLVGFFGAVGMLVIFLAVGVAAAWILWGSDG